MTKRYSIAILLILFSGCLIAQQFRLNQLGFYSKSQKIAIITESQYKTFTVINASTGQIVYSDTISTPKYWNNSGENVSIADFSKYTQEGSYYLQVGNSKSSLITIKQKDVFTNLSKWSIKAFYLWRASTAIQAKNAQFGKVNFARNTGHADTRVLVHSSAATILRPASTLLSAPKGWYDAGDYNLYTVNASQAVFSLLQLYENYSSIYDTLNLNIPESSNSVPDILDEVKWETDWLLNMIDTNDGAVYHKLTSLSFCGMVEPDKDYLTRYMVGRSTAATLDFAAMMAKAARSFRKYNKIYPRYADTLIIYAKKAYNWALKNPSNNFTSNPSGVSTGSYSDGNSYDEFFWAKCELFLTTGDNTYLNDININSVNFGTPTWNSVQTLGLLSLYQSLDTITISSNDKNTIINTVLAISNSMVSICNSTPYHTVINTFAWGSNGYTSSQGQILLTAYKKTRNIQYLNTALSVLDYLLGRNATGYSFVSGFGNRTPLKLHDRRSEGDAILQPLPGYLVGGPTINAQTDCGATLYPSTFPAKSYLDLNCSFSTNEIAINWQGPFAYIVGAIDAELNNVAISPYKAETDTIGSLIYLSFPTELTSNIIPDSSLRVYNNTNIISIDSIKVNSTNNKILSIYIPKNIITKDSNNLHIICNGNNLQTISGLVIDSTFAIKVINNIKGANSYIIEAYTNIWGDSIYVKTNKKIGYLGKDSNLFNLFSNGKNIIESISINKRDSSIITFKINRIFNDQTIILNYLGSTVTNLDSSKLLNIQTLTVLNNGLQSAPKELEINASENGNTVSITFDKSIIANNSKLQITPIVYNRITKKSQTISISYYSISNYILSFTISPRFIKGDSLTISYKSGCLFSIYGDSVLSFNNLSCIIPITSNQDTVLITKDSTTQIQAENYAYNSGFSTETCTDTLGTKNLSYADVGDWVDYFVNVKDSGNYIFTSRVASTNTSSLIVKNISTGGNVIGRTTITSTGGWQIWNSVSTNILLDKGIQTLRIYDQSNQFNLNWIQFEYGTLTNKNIISPSNFSIYPNPSANGIFHFETEILDSNTKIKVIDSAGNIVFEKRINIDTKNTFVIKSLRDSHKSSSDFL